MLTELVHSMPMVNFTLRIALRIWYVASSYINLLLFKLAKDLVVVVAVDIMMTGREVGIKNGVLVIETAAEKGDDE